MSGHNQCHASMYNIKGSCGAGGHGGNNMKNKFYFCAMLMAMSMTANAQTEGKSIGSGDGVFVVPKLFTYGDNRYVVTIDGKEVSVYNDDIDLVRSFQINPTEYTVGQETQQRTAVVRVESVLPSEPMTIMEDDGYTEVLWTGTWDQAREWAASRNLNLLEKENFQLWADDESSYFKPEKYGFQYPGWYYQWNANNGTIVEVGVTYRENLTGEWETIEGDSWTYSGGAIEQLDFEDYDDNTHPDQGFYLSQTLFNTDEKFEYLVPLYEPEDYTSSERDADGDGEIDTRTIQHGLRNTGYQIMSEDGTVIQTINSTGYAAKIIKINEKTYLIVEDSDETVFYKIDQQKTNLSRVATMPVSLAKSIFSLDGRKLSSAQRGINIVRNSDGSATKFLEK